MKYLPHNCLANVGRNEKGNTASQAVAFLQQFVQNDDNNSGEEQLKNNQQRAPCTPQTPTRNPGISLQ